LGCSHDDGLKNELINKFSNNLLIIQNPLAGNLVRRRAKTNDNRKAARMCSFNDFS